MRTEPNESPNKSPNLLETLGCLSVTPPIDPSATEGRGLAAHEDPNVTVLPNGGCSKEQSSPDPTCQTSGAVLIWRQSLIHDILRCPRMASRDWVYTPQGSSFGSVNSCVSDDGRKGFIAAVFGTAAHKVIQDFNEALNPPVAAPDTPLFDAAGVAVTACAPRELNYTELLASFEREALNGYEITQEIIPIPKGCETFTDSMNSVGADYMQYIIGHLALEKVREPKLVVNASEQQFVMFVIYLGDVYVFYGTIDQICSIPEEDKLIVRDFKFRDAAFKPSWRQLQVDPQLIIYACALKHGIPCCNDCKPRYAEDAEFALVSNRKIVYDGPCDACKAKVGTHEWPKEYPDAGELTWMKDFRILKRGTAHRKKGEVAGQANYEFRFNSVNVNAYMYDIMQHCRGFRYGSFPRKYGEACKFWCRHSKSCVGDLHNEAE